MDPVNVPAKFCLVALPVPEIIAIVVLDGVLRASNLGKGDVEGREWYRRPKERW